MFVHYIELECPVAICLYMSYMIYSGCPSIVRLDNGTENTLLAAFHNSLYAMAMLMILKERKVTNLAPQPQICTVSLIKK